MNKFAQSEHFGLELALVVRVLTYSKELNTVL